MSAASPSPPGALPAQRAEKSAPALRTRPNATHIPSGIPDPGDQLAGCGMTAGPLREITGAARGVVDEAVHNHYCRAHWRRRHAVERQWNPLASADWLATARKCVDCPTPISLTPKDVCNRNWRRFGIAFRYKTTQSHGERGAGGGFLSDAAYLLNPYETKPARLLAQVSYRTETIPPSGIYCAGFELAVWRCDALADHLIEWIADYALNEDELRVHHGNMYVRLREAAARIYSSAIYAQRGEIGEIVLHAICREFFGTIPFAPRVFYLTSSNDVVKSFDMVHVRYPVDGPELWLGEAKFFENGVDGARAAVRSLTQHLDQGFLRNEKLILGPQVSKSVPDYQRIRELLSVQTSLDELFRTAIFPVCITSESAATSAGEKICEEYAAALHLELAEMSRVIATSGLPSRARIVLLHLPLGSKQKLADAFDLRLKGLRP